MSRLHTETNPAYNLPVDTVYYLESKWNYKLNEYVRAHEREITEALNKKQNAYFPFKFKYVSRLSLDENELQDLVALQHPDHKSNKLEKVVSKKMSFFAKRKTFKEGKNEKIKSNYKKLSLLCRLMPKADESENRFDFLYEDLELVDINGITNILHSFIMDVNEQNRRRLLNLPEPDPFEEVRFLIVANKTESETIDEDASTQKSTNEVLSNKTANKRSKGQFEYLFDIAETLDEGVLREIGNISDYKRGRKTVQQDQDEDICCSYSLELPPVDARALAIKIRDDIAALQRSNGINILVETLGQEFIDSLKQLPKTLPSPLVVDEEFRILLPRYDNMEIQMNKLSKTLYFLFLLHPNGIRIKELDDYKYKLMEIYKLVSERENISTMRRSIDDLTDISSNSVNEKMSRIRAAFCKHLSTDLAQHYIPQGERGEAKRIVLPSDQITLPQNITNIRG